MVSIFSDKATIIIRTMLSAPKRKWVVRDFGKEFNISCGRTATVLGILRKKGFVTGTRAGRLAYSMLINKKELIEEWTKVYNFDLNNTHLYYSPKKDVLERLREYFTKRGLFNRYALTLHTGANLVTNYVNIDSVYCYLDSEDFKEISLDLRQGLDWKELKTGGNIFLIKPYYKKSVFLNRQKIKGYNVVSNLQLYLDLYNFPQRGREHAEYLLRVIKEKGESFA